MIRKSLAVLCCFSLLGQNTLYASADKTNPAEQKPQTLAEYQQRAKEDIQRTPWINREGKYILALGGVSAGALIIQQVRFHHKQMAQQKNWERERIKLAGQNAEEVAFLQQKLGASQAAQREAEKELLATHIGWEMHEQALMRKTEKEIIHLNDLLEQAQAEKARLEQKLASQAKWYSQELEQQLHGDWRKKLPPRPAPRPEPVVAITDPARLLNPARIEKAAVPQPQMISEWKDLQASAKAAEEKIASLEKALAQAQAEKTDLQRQLRYTEKKVNGLQRSNKLHRQKYAALQKASVVTEGQLAKEIELLNYKIKNFLLPLTYYSSRLDEEMQPYAKLFDKNTSQEQRQLLRNQLLNEPWMQKVSSAHQKEFLDILDRAAEYRMHSYQEAGDSFMRFLIRESIEKNMPLYERLIAMCRQMSGGKNLLTIGFLVALGMSAHDVKAQNMATRININFDLFLNATPEELAEMEKNKEVRDVCVQGAEALHQMSLMSDEEALYMQQSVQGNAPSQPQTSDQPSVNLAR